MIRRLARHAATVPAFLALAFLAGDVLAEGRRMPAVPEAAPDPAAEEVPTATAAEIAILCYHDLSNDPDAPGLTVSPGFLRDQIRRHRADGWHFMRLSTLLSYRDRPDELPPRVMVLTFDDGYESFLTEALPVLREESVEATLAVITSFVDKPPPNEPPMLSWEQLREIQRSGLVDIASHSHDLHRWIPNNPYKDTAPSVTTRRYLLDEARYETRDEYRERIRNDLRTSREILRKKLAQDTSVLVWPFGEHNEMARALAAEAGFSVTLVLEDREVLPADLASGTLPRVMITRRTELDPALGWLRPKPGAVRAAQVDLDVVYHKNPETFERNVDLMVDRVRQAGATHVILQGLPDPKGDGRFRETWFMNHQAPVKADVWSRVATALHHAGLKVWIRVPVMNLPWEWERHPDWRIPRKRKKRGDPDPWYLRLSPDVPGARIAALDFYADIAVYLPIDGILFDDDLYMLPHEKLRLSASTDPAVKSETMRTMIEDVKSTVRKWRPQARFGRNLYAPAAERRGLNPMFAQDLDQFLRDYDLTVIMAYAHMEGHGGDADRWVAGLVKKTLKRWTGTGPAPVLFKLQAYDWESERWLDEGELMGQAREARRAGAVHLGVYPFDPEDGSIPTRLLEAPTARGNSADREPAGKS